MREPAGQLGVRLCRARARAALEQEALLGVEPRDVAVRRRRADDDDAVDEVGPPGRQREGDAASRRPAERTDALDVEVVEHAPPGRPPPLRRSTTDSAGRGSERP